MKKFLPHSVQGFFFTLLLLSANAQAFAQSDTISTSVLHDAETLVRDFFLAGNCIDVFNFQLSGELGQAGTFTNGMASIGLEDGIVLSTGNVLDAIGPNSDSETSTLYDNLGSDPDLEKLDTIFTGNDTPRTLSDIVILEFDFTPTVEMASFEFVFASEEYCYYTLTSFIDIFGFFVSGPGINGPYQNNGSNIALVPGTQTPITAFSINEFNNAQYYNSNAYQVDLDAICYVTPPVAPDFIEFDGFTVPLEASFPVIPCETYHVKLAITDTTDDILDSAVFLKAQSFIAGRTSDITSNIIGENEGENAPYEGCGSAEVIFLRADDVDTSDLVVHYDILPTSTATPGIDFTMLPDSIIIPAGVSADTFNLEFFNDGLVEGNEVFTIKLRNPCSCTESELAFTIIDPLPLSGFVEGVDKVCEGDALELIATPQGGFGETYYQWPNGNLDSIYNTVPATSFNHQLVLSDDCFQTDTIDFFVDVLSPQATIDGNGVICDGLPEFSYFVELAGADTFSFDILQGGVTAPYTDIVADTFWIPATSTGIFQVINAFADGCPATTNGFAQVLEVDIVTQVTIDSIDCFEVFDAMAVVRPNDGDGVYSYMWSHDNLISLDTAFNLGIGDYSVFINDSQGCLDTVHFSLDQPSQFLLEIDTLQLEVTCDNNGALLAISQGGITPYSYNWSNGPTTALNDNLLPNLYTLIATDANDCQEEVQVQIIDNDDLPFIELFMSDSLDCSVQTVTVSTGNSSIGLEYIYIWTNAAGDTLALPNPTNWSTSLAGTYRLEIRDTTSNCSDSMSITVEEDTVAPPAQIQSSLINLDCYQTSATLNAEQAHQDWSATWYDLDADTLITTNQWFIDVFNGGDFELVVINTLNTCESRDTFHINEQFNSPIASIPTPDSLNCDASQIELSVDISNGSGNYTYEWSGPVNGIDGDTDMATATALLAGSYQLVLTDVFNGCFDTLTTNVIIDESSLMIDHLPDTALSCLVQEVILTANSPTPGNLQYSWENSDNVTISNSATVTITAIGNYTVNVIDVDNNCNQSATVMVSGDYVEPTINPNLVEDLNCTDTTTQLSAVPYTNHSAIWLNDANDTLAQNAWSYQANSTGDYYLQVTDNNNGCFSNYTYTVGIDTINPVATVFIPGNLTCEITDIDLTTNVSQGSGNYTYNWTGPLGGINGVSNENIVNVGNMGSYNLLLTDNDNGCDILLTAEVMENGDFPEIAPLPDTTIINCFAATTMIEASSPTNGDLSFKWVDSDNVVVSTTAVLLADQGGVYEIQLTNNDNDCVSTFGLLIEEDFTPPTADAGLDAEINCLDQVGVLEAIQGATHLTPSWLDQNGAVLSMNEWTLTTGTIGTYQLNVFDNQNGCSNTDTAEVGINQNTPNANAGQDLVLDCFTNSAEIDASNSSVGSNISYALYDNFGELVQDGNTNIFSVDQTGIYQLIVTNNDNHCTDEDDIVVSVETPEIVAIETINAYCFGLEGSIVIETIIGGTPPYLYSIDGGETFQVSNVFSQLDAGLYQLRVQDINGCEGTGTGVIEEPQEMVLLLPEIINLNIGDSIALDPEFNRDTTGLTSILWSNSTQLSCQKCLNPQFNALETQILELTIVDENGCDISAQVLIVVDERIPVYIPNAFSPNNLDGTNDLFIIYGDNEQVIEISYLNIYDRWGNLIFAENNFSINTPDYAWDGTFAGQKLNAGIFVYTIEVLLLNGKTAHFEGEIMLLD